MDQRERELLRAFYGDKEGFERVTLPVVEPWTVGLHAKPRKVLFQQLYDGRWQFAPEEDEDCELAFRRFLAALVAKVAVDLLARRQIRGVLRRLGIPRSDRDDVLARATVDLYVRLEQRPLDRRRDGLVRLATSIAARRAADLRKEAFFRHRSPTPIETLRPRSSSDPLEEVDHERALERFVALCGESDGRCGVIDVLLKGKSVADVARALGISDATLRQRVHRARRDARSDPALRELLMNRCSR